MGRRPSPQPPAAREDTRRRYAEPRRGTDVGGSEAGPGPSDPRGGKQTNHPRAQPSHRTAVRHEGTHGDRAVRIPDRAEPREQDERLGAGAPWLDRRCLHPDLHQSATRHQRRPRRRRMDNEGDSGISPRVDARARSPGASGVLSTSRPQPGVQAGRSSTHGATTRRAGKQHGPGAAPGTKIVERSLRLRAHARNGRREDAGLLLSPLPERGSLRTLRATGAPPPSGAALIRGTGATRATRSGPDLARAARRRFWARDALLLVGMCVFSAAPSPHPPEPPP